jgi:hypothetical protein
MRSHSMYAVFIWTLGLILQEQKPTTIRQGRASNVAVFVLPKRVVE